MIIECEDTLDEFRRAAVCSWCGRKTPQGCDPDHVFTRGTGRLDVRINLASLCRWCHTRRHCQNRDPSRDDLLSLVAEREGTTSDEIQEMIWALRRKRA